MDANENGRTECDADIAMVEVSVHTYRILMGQKLAALEFAKTTQARDATVS